MKPFKFSVEFICFVGLALCFIVAANGGYDPENPRLPISLTIPPLVNERNLKTQNVEQENQRTRNIDELNPQPSNFVPVNPNTPNFVPENPQTQNYVAMNPQTPIFATVNPQTPNFVTVNRQTPNIDVDRTPATPWLKYSQITNPLNNFPSANSVLTGNTDSYTNVNQNSYVTHVKHPQMSSTMKSNQSQENSTEIMKECLDPEGNKGVCQLHYKCAPFYTQFILTKKMQNSKCRMENGLQGICCQEVSKPEEVATLIKEKTPEIYANINGLIARVNEEADSIADFIVEAINHVDETELELMQNPENVVEPGTASHGHLQFFMTSQKALKMARSGYGLLSATNDVRIRLNLQDDEAGIGLKRFSMNQSVSEQNCVQQRQCNIQHNYYRTIDGSCNNIYHSNMGMAFSPLYRVLQPKYSDGLWSLRSSILGKEYPLPNPRKLSTSIATDENWPHQHYSLWVMQYGQFVDHDMSHVPIHRYHNMSGIQCCRKDGRGALPERERHPQCLPIDIPKEDPFYRAYRQRCMNFVRSMVGPRADCSLGYADQLNQVTSYLDSSNIYGSRIEEENELRLKKDGLLKSRVDSDPSIHIPANTAVFEYLNKQMLPTVERPGDECSHPESNETYCFRAGDLRANEMIGLTTTHVLWFREHNRIARNLKEMNPSWNDNELFFETRRLVNAIYQHITYNEWLPIILGRNFMSAYGILPLSKGYAVDYEVNIDPTVSNAFAAAAYRMGHSLIQGLMTLHAELGKPEETLLIHEHFNNPFSLEKVGVLDRVLRALGDQPIQNFDNYVSNEVTNRLFQPHSNHYGLDLVSLNIQRGRDHGLPSYNDFREVCQLGRAKSFDDLLHHVSAKKVHLLRREYKSVDDIDLFIGGLSENNLPGALVGPTFVCLIGDQFARSKKGDRFAYDLGGEEHSFTLAQLTEIRTSTFARLICDNSDNIRTVQPLVFYMPHSGYNPMTNCDSPLIPKLDLSKWKYY